MSDTAMILMDLVSIVGWIMIGIGGMILKDIMQDTKFGQGKLRWELMYLILPLLLLYPSFLFYQYFYNDVVLSKKIITGLIILFTIGSLLLLYLAHQIRTLQLKRELSGVAASILVVYLGVSVYSSFQLTDFGEVLNNLLFTTAMFMLSLAMFYLGNYTFEFSKVVKVAPLLYFAGIAILFPGIVRAFIVDPDAFGWRNYLFLLKLVGTIGIVGAGVAMFISADRFKQRVLEFAVRLK